MINSVFYDYKYWEMLTLLVCLLVPLEGNNFGAFWFLGENNDFLD